MILIRHLLQVGQGNELTLCVAYICETLKVLYVGFKPLWEVGTKVPLRLVQTETNHNTAPSSVIDSVETWKMVPDDLLEDDLVNEDDLLDSSEPPLPSKSTDCSTKRRACKVVDHFPTIVVIAQILLV